MTKQEINRAVYEALAIDYGCNPEDFTKKQFLVIKNENRPGRRQYQTEPAAFSLCANGTSVIIMCDERYYDWAIENFSEGSPEWIFEFPNLAKIEKKLNEDGLCIADAHEFYLPLVDFPKAAVPDNIEIKWYDREEILQFKDKAIGKEAYAFNERYPDMLGVSASLDGELVAMAGASRDWQSVWQIGIRVEEKAEGKGIGTLLTSLLKEKLISMDIVPFYGTAVSHMSSQNVARRAGFYPAWAELYSK